jgi:hypothetical protein
MTELEHARIISETVDWALAQQRRPVNAISPLE